MQFDRLNNELSIFELNKIMKEEQGDTLEKAYINKKQKHSSESEEM